MGKTASIKQTNPQDLADALQREAQLKKTRAELMKVLFNRAGLTRLGNITDANWQRAEEQDATGSD